MYNYLVYQLAIWKEKKNFLFYEKNIGFLMRKVSADNKVEAIEKYKKRINEEFSDPSFLTSEIFAKPINEIPSID